MIPKRTELSSQSPSPMLLFTTCSQIRDEATPIFYKETNFWGNTVNAIQSTVSRAMMYNQHINIRHSSLVSFSEHLTGSTLDTRHYWHHSAADAFVNILLDSPQVKVLEVPHRLIPGGDFDGL